MSSPTDPSLIIGLTSTIPVEIVFAAGLTPLDLNNLFITSAMPERLLRQAEAAGFSFNVCAWIKGIYSTTLNQRIRSLIAVTGGDCSNTLALAEVLASRGVRIIPFEYPMNQERELLLRQMENLGISLSANRQDISVVKSRLDRIREKLKVLDILTYAENLVTGFENHLFLVTSSDFKSDPDLYEKELDHFLKEVKKRVPKQEDIRLGYLGVPPICAEIYDAVESMGARVVFNEIQRQFSMPYYQEDIVSQYLLYTYPYGISGRMRDILAAIQERNLDGLIHYTQTFCYRQIYDIIFRESLPLPLLTLEGDRPGSLDARTLLRLETFVEMLRRKKEA